LSYAWREALELSRDPIRLTPALLGSVILMFIMGYGITMDVENLTLPYWTATRRPSAAITCSILPARVTGDCRLPQRACQAELLRE
jgi:hypothetical protein